MFRWITAEGIFTYRMKTVISGRLDGHRSERTLTAMNAGMDLGIPEFIGERDGIGAEVLIFVPQNFNGEVQKVSIKNKSDRS